MPRTASLHVAASTPHVALAANVRAQRGQRMSPAGCPPAFCSCSSVVWQMGQARWKVRPVPDALLLLGAAVPGRNPEPAAAAPPPVCASAACCAAACGLHATALQIMCGSGGRSEAGDAAGFCRRPLPLRSEPFSLSRLAYEVEPAEC